MVQKSEIGHFIIVAKQKHVLELFNKYFGIIVDMLDNQIVNLDSLVELESTCPNSKCRAMW